MSKVQTENSYLGAKIKLRLRNLPDKKEINVLDCFSANGTLWREIKKLSPGKKINVLRIDNRNDLDGFYLEGDNEKFLEQMNLDRFDVIDLDSFGMPTNQLMILFKKKIKGKTVFVTFIQSILRQMSHEILYKNGITDEMIKKCPTLFGKRGWAFFKNFLALNGVCKIKTYQSQRKNYLCFSV